MKGLLGVAMALIMTACCHAVASHYWRPLLPWKTNIVEALWWHAPVNWLALGTLLFAAVALLVLGLWAVYDSTATTGRSFGRSLGVVALPYLASVSLYALTGPPIRAVREANPILRSDSPAIEIKVSSVADAETGLARVRENLRNTLTPAITRLTSDVDDVKSRLKASGITSSADLKENARGRVLAQELAETIRYRNAVAFSIETHRAVEFELDSLVRRLKRAELVSQAGVPEGEFLRINATVRILDGQLAERGDQEAKEISATELDELIDKELATKSEQTADESPTAAATH